MDPPIDPLALIQSLFQAHLATTGGRYDASWLDAVPAAFLALLPDEAALSSLPLVTAASLRAGALPARGLVRYVGMVQDTFEPELYAPIREVESLGASHRRGPPM